MKAFVVLLTAAVLGVVGCSSRDQGGTAPGIAGGSAAASGGSATSGSSGSPGSRPRVGFSPSRVTQLHAAAQCLREHGVPNYQDPVLTADGYVYTDARALQDALARLSRAQQDAALSAFRGVCGQLFATAGLQPDDQSPAPPPLVQAGVRAARCLRANGLPSYRDPTADTQFTPGHGFGLTNDELPNNGALGKQDPVVQRAFSACRTLLDAEITASSLGSLAHD